MSAFDRAFDQRMEPHPGGADDEPSNDDAEGPDLRTSRDKPGIFSDDIRDCGPSIFPVRPLTDLDPLPCTGSQVGRYTFLREIAKGPFGPLYELRAEADTGLGGLARLVTLPDDLSPEVEQSIAEAAWESMELRHDFAINVADVVFGTGWVTLIHDYSEGSLLRSLQRRAQERQSVFPVPIALRILLDLLQGLDGIRDACNASGIACNPGGVTAASLYLCGDGRARLLDGQLMTTLIRAKPMREHADGLGIVAPEVLDGGETDERTDVFAAGAVLWELVTGQELAREAGGPGKQRSRLPSVSLAVPKGTTIPLGVTQTIRAALELDPKKRLATRDELRSSLTKVAEPAPYEKVIDFVDALLHRESTLFRLTLEPAPRLSDKLRSERPKPPRPQRDLAQTKRERPAVAPKLAQLQPRAVPAKPNLSAPRAIEAPQFGKGAAQRTLIGISATSLFGQQSAAPRVIAQSPAVPAPEADEVVELAPVQPEPVDSSDLDNSDSDETVVRFNREPAANPVASVEPEPTAPFASGVRDTNPEPAQAAPRAIADLISESTTVALPIHRGANLEPAALNALALPELATHGEAVAPAQAEATAAVAPRVVADSLPAMKPAASPEFQLSLRTIVIGLLATVVVAVGCTILTLRLFLTRAPNTSSSATPSTQPRLPAAAEPAPVPPAAETVASNAAPAAEPVASTTQPQAAPSTDSSASAAAAVSAAVAAPATADSTAAAVPAVPAAPKSITHKRKRQYTPHGL